MVVLVSLVGAVIPVIWGVMLRPIVVILVLPMSAMVSVCLQISK